jgi:hypothetical protein
MRSREMWATEGAGMDRSQYAIECCDNGRLPTSRNELVSLLPLVTSPQLLPCFHLPLVCHSQ